jgi:hypothetical protein
MSLSFEVLLDVGILLGYFDLVDFEWDAQAFRKIAFGYGEIARARIAGVEMLVIPVIRRRDDGAGFPV